MFLGSTRTALLAIALAPLAACAETSPSGAVAAPASSAAPPVPDTLDAGGAPARFLACRADTDCVAVPRVGCCHNGWNEAVAASQKDAYEASFVCPEAHPICAMFIVRDARQARCDKVSGLCVLVAN